LIGDAIELKWLIAFFKPGTDNGSFI